jgi:hypothetical protein
MNRIAFITLATSLFAACSSDDDNTPSAADYDDTAQAIGSTMATGSGGGDVGSMTDSVALSLGVMPLGLSLGLDGKVNGNRLGLDYSYTATCKDASGTTLALCDDTTDQAEVDVSWSGDLDTANVDASVSRDGTWTLTGLQGDTATLKGDSSFSLQTKLQSIFRPGASTSLSFDANADYDVQISTDDRAMVGGTASFDVTAHRVVTGTSNDVDKTFHIAADVEFAADGKADLVLDGSEHYTLDLATGIVGRVNR